LKGEYAVPEGLYYTKDHEWLRIEGDNCRVGVTDYAQKSLHEIVYVELPKVGMKASQMQSLGTVESVKAVADVYSPISGEVLEVNNSLSDAPELVNKSPYGQGWIVRMKPANQQAELAEMLTGEAAVEAYRQKIEKEQLKTCVHVEGFDGEA